MFTSVSVTFVVMLVTLMFPPLRFPPSSYVSSSEVILTILVSFWTLFVLLFTSTISLLCSYFKLDLFLAAGWGTVA
jgi:hypothetical protein